MTRLRSVRVLAALAAHVVLGGCWPGWAKIFEQTPSREHRVEDMRILAVEVDPGSLVVPAEMLRTEGSTAVLKLDVTPRAFDPRGGDFTLSVGLCVAPFDGAPCEGEGIDPVERTVHANKNAALGPARTTVTFELNAADVRRLYREVDLDPRSLVSVALMVVVNATRAVDGITEREQATLGIEMRADPLDPLVPSDELAQAAGYRCGFNPELIDVLCGEPNATPAGTCGDDVVQPGESCEPPGTPDLCDDTCHSAAICPRAVTVCAREMVPNRAPVLRGLYRDSHSDDGVDPEFVPNSVISVDTGSELQLAASLERSDEKRQVVFGAFSDANFVDEGGPRGPGGQTVDEEGNGCPAPPFGQFICPQLQTTTVRFYIADGDAEIVSPADELGNYIGNTGESGGAITLRFGSKATTEPLVVVLSDGAGGMSVASFTFDVR